VAQLIVLYRIIDLLGVIQVILENTLDDIDWLAALFGHSLSIERQTLRSENYHPYLQPGAFYEGLPANDCVPKFQEWKLGLAELLLAW